MGIALRELQHCNAQRDGDKKVGETFENRNEKLLPLQCQIEIADRRSLRVKIARFKSRNCAH